MSGKQKVLLVEDDQFLLKMYHKKFENEGFEVFVAHNGEEGIEEMKKVKPDFVCMDIMMPKMNGLQALDVMKQDPELKPIPVLILTNLSSTDDADTAIQKGAAGYVVKSDVTPAHVVDKVRELLTAHTTE